MAPRYRFPPAARVLWRSPDQLQVELGAHAVVVDAVDSDFVDAVGLRAGPSPDTPASASPAETHAALATLTAAGLLWPAVGADAEDERLAAPRPRLAAELRALSARAGERAAEAMSARRSAAVVVQGSGPLAVQLAAVLAASGVGRLQVVGDGDVHLRQAVPGGLRPGDEGRRFDRAAADAVLTAAPECDTAALRAGERPDLVVLAAEEPIEAERYRPLQARDWTHLAVTTTVDGGAVGPLVIPGLTSCLRCADLHRLDRDPAWPALAAQLGVAPRYGPASTAAATTLLAGLAALQALDYLDGGRPATVEGTLELHLPDWRVRRRTWPVHSGCDCQRG